MSETLEVLGEKVTISDMKNLKLKRIVTKEYGFRMRKVSGALNCERTRDYDDDWRGDYNDYDDA